MAGPASEPGGDRAGLSAEPQAGPAWAFCSGGGVMVWVTWRHHRTQVAACTCLVAAACLLLYALGGPMHLAWSGGPAGCLNATTGTCNGLLAGFQNRFTGSLEQLLGWLNLL